jgi:hypothetical protein
VSPAAISLQDDAEAKMPPPAMATSYDVCAFVSLGWNY